MSGPGRLGQAHTGKRPDVTPADKQLWIACRRGLCLERNECFPVCVRQAVSMVGQKRIETNVCGAYLFQWDFYL